MRGYSELYRAGALADPVDMEQAMARIGSESRRMAALVEDMLLLARLDQGRPLRHDAVPLSELVNDAMLDMRAVDPDRPVEAEVESSVVVSGDEDRLRQVIGNLVDQRPRPHRRPDTPIEVALSARNGYSTLKVADHGPGIDPTHVEHIFDRFYRADSGRSRDRGGSGLGLSIAASVAAAHGGEIVVLEHARRRRDLHPDLAARRRARATRRGRMRTLTRTTAESEPKRTREARQNRARECR